MSNRVGYWLGKKHTDEYKKKMSESCKGINTWKKGYTPSPEQIKKASVSCKKSLGTVEMRLKMSLARKGKPKTKEWNDKNSLAQMGEKNHNWQGGKTSLSIKIRTCRKYKYWRKAVFERDNFICIFCKRNGYINADHIKPFSLILKENNIKTLEEALICKELWDINNGRTLCLECHQKTDTFSHNLIRKNKIQ